MKFSKQIVSIISIHLASSALLFAGAGHDHGPTPGEQTSAISGPVQISSQAKQNIQLETAEADFITLEKTLFAIGQIDAIPGKRLQVSSRIPGRVLELLVTEGEAVKEGQLLARIESRQPGNPPPVIEFKAPQDGLITNLHVFKGTNVEPDTHLLDVIDLSEVYGRAQVYEGQISQLKNTQKARIRLEAYPDEVFEGTFERMAAELDPLTRTLPVWFRFKNPEDRIRLNMRATFDIVIEENPAAIAVENAAILGENGNYFVFVEKDADKFIYKKEAVVIGLNDDKHTEIIEGVLPGDKVVTAGNYQLQYLPVMEVIAEEDPHDHTGHDHEDGDEHAHEADHSLESSETNKAQQYISNVIYGLFGISLILNFALFAALGRKSKNSDKS